MPMSSGTITSCVPRDGGKLLVASNGAYGDRIIKMAQVYGIPVVSIHAKEDEMFAPEQVDE